jgi:hypothetical protein
MGGAIIGCADSGLVVVVVVAILPLMMMEPLENEPPS